MKFWAPNQPHEHIQQPLSREKVTVWCAIGKGGIVGPFFFEDNDGNPVTVNSERCIQLLQIFKGGLFQLSEEGGILTSTQLFFSTMGHHLIFQT